MQTTSDRFRVYASARHPDGLSLAQVPTDPLADDPDAYELTDVAGSGHDAEGVTSLYPGVLVDATLSWQTPEPTITALSVVRDTRFSFARDVTGLFEAARTTWADAKRRGDGVNSRVTRNTDGVENGALYTFAEQPGRDLFEEFRTGVRPLDPLLARVDDATRATHAVDAASPDGDAGADRNAGADGAASADGAAGADGPAGSANGGSAREVFVLDPAEERCVVVYVALDRDGVLASTVRDTYDVT